MACAPRAGDGAHADSDAREGQREQRDGNGGHERAPVYEPRFVAQARDEIFVFQALFARIPVARAPRGERDSSLLARLQQPQARHPDGKEDDGAQQAGRVVHDEQEGGGNAHRQGHDAEQTPLALFARADVGDFGNHWDQLQHAAVVITALATTTTITTTTAPSGASRAVARP